MRINERIYDYAIEEKLVERQELDGHVVEIYSLNDYPDLLEEFTNKGKFAVWSCRDGKDYRLFLEEGYYKEVKELYSTKINDIWLRFWDRCEKIANKFRNLVLPLTIVLMVVIAVLTFLVKDSTAKTIAVLAIAIAFFVGVIIYRKYSNKLFADANRESVDEIKVELGEKRFEKLLERQRGYIDSYFKYEDPVEDDENNESLEETSENVEEALLDNTVESSEEINEDNENKVE